MNYEIIFAGLLISLILTELTGVYPGGLIVPAFLVIYFEQPERIAGTLAAAVLSAACYKIISNHLILFGKRRLLFMIFLGGLWTYLGSFYFPGILPVSAEFKAIGWVIPGIMANNFDRQGIVITTSMLIVALVLTYLAGRLIFFLL